LGEAHLFWFEGPFRMGDGPVYSLTDQSSKFLAGSLRIGKT